MHSATSDTAASTVVFRVDASARIGGGHVSRCLTLAQTLGMRGWDCGFAINPGAERVIPALERPGITRMTLDCAAQDEAIALRDRWPAGVDWLVVDHYGRDSVFESACRPWARRILVIDDLANRGHDCDALLDQTLGRSAEAYAAHVPAHCRLFTGTRYALLRSRFTELRSQSLARRRSDAPVRRLLISMGATDAVDATGTLLISLRKAQLDVELDIVLSAAAPHLESVRSAAAGLASPARLHTHVEDMAGLMLNADLAIGAAGTTAWERCCLGLPSVLVVTADNQRLIAAALQSAGAATVCGDHENLGMDDLISAVRRLCLDHAARRRMSARAAQVCDGAGVERLVENLPA